MRKGRVMIDMSAYTPTREELEFLGEQAGYEVTVEDGDRIEPPQVKGIRIPDVQGIIEELSKTIIVEGPEAYVDYINANLSRVREAAAFDEKVVEVLVTGYKMGVAQKHGPCANNLGALYYSGEFVEQDYEKAAELYELAMDWGCYQSTVKLVGEALGIGSRTSQHE